MPRGHYPCCIAGNNDGPPDGVGGISRHNEFVRAFGNPEAWKALLAEVGWPGWMQRGFEPTYLDIGDINGALGLIFPAHDDAYLSVLVIGEIERGIERIRKRDPKSATRLRRWLTNLSTQFESRILPVTLPIARAWGKMGDPNPIPTVDGLLAATAHTHGLILATRNVTHIESLDIEWLNPFD